MAAEQEREEQAEMPFLDHLEELRWRLIWSGGALLLAIVAAFTITSNFDVIGLLAIPAQESLHGQKLIYTHPADPFTILLQVSFALGVVGASPVIGYQIWAFLSPALHPHEKRVMIPVVMGALLLFLAGCALCVGWVLPITLKLLAGISSASLQQMISAADYFSFAVTLTLAFGAVFELPILILALTMLGLVTPATLAKFRRHAFVGSLIASALITPGDLIIATAMMFVPLYGLYEVSIILSWFVFRAKERKARREEEAERRANASGR
ncbi:MAG: twin-arginine translocase subunit TatC [Gemmatimonadota bacterium]|nr:twin-arginine translocase subunit TatC [Gemmatimonadota bacterium]